MDPEQKKREKDMVGPFAVMGAVKKHNKIV